MLRMEAFIHRTKPKCLGQSFKGLYSVYTLASFTLQILNEETKPDMVPALGE